MEVKERYNQKVTLLLRMFEEKSLKDFNSEPWILSSSNMRQILSII